MSNDSSTGGYLQPYGVQPADDAALDAQIQALVVGITGLDGTLVRPRWQPNPPKQPDYNVNWAAVGIQSRTGDDTSALIHYKDPVTSPTLDGHSELRRHEVLEIVASFYGPNSTGYASLFRDGLSVSQNREVIQSQGMGLIDVAPAIMVPDLVNQQWLRRVDVTMRIRRAVSRTYPVENLLEAVGEIRTDSPPHTEPFDTINHR